MIKHMKEKDIGQYGHILSQFPQSITFSVFCA